MNLRLPSIPLSQRDTPELLDSREFPRPEVARSLSDVARINSFLSANGALFDCVWAMIERAGLKSATVLDVGAGNGDFARRLCRQAQKRGFELNVIALDISPLHLQIAQEQTPTEAAISWVAGDVFALPLANESVDIVCSSLFLHHFRPSQIELLLGECCRVARVGWAMNDCARDGVALMAFRVLRPILARSFLTRFDAPASIRRSYTSDELCQVVTSIPSARVRAHFPYRLQVEWMRDLTNLTSP